MLLVFYYTFISLTLLADSRDPLATPSVSEEEAGFQDTESDISASFNEVISNLQTLRRDIDENSDRRPAKTEEDGIRHRTS